MGFHVQVFRFFCVERCLGDLGQSHYGDLGSRLFDVLHFRDAACDFFEGKLEE